MKQALLQVHGRLARRRRERVIALPRERHRPAVANEDGDERGDRHEDERDGEREPHLRGRRDPPLGEPEERAGERRGSREQDQVHGELVAVVGRGGEGRIGSRQGVRVRREQDGERRGGRERDGSGDELQATGIDRDCNGEPDSAGDPCSAAEREVDRCEQERQGRCGQGARRDRLRAGREAEREQRTHDREDAERVPVRQRLREAVLGNGVEDAESLGEEPRQQPVARGEEDGREGRREDERHRGAPNDDEQRGEGGDVQQQALALEHGRGDVVAPEQREPGPHTEPGEAAEREEGEARRLDRRAENEQRRDDDERNEGAPGPGRREVAAARERDQRQAENQAEADARATGVEARARCLCGQLSQFRTSVRG